MQDPTRPRRAPWRVALDYLGLGRRGRLRRIDSPAGLSEFVQTRASHVCQTSLYGYIRARAGTRYPELFEHETFLISINIAKWQIWLACLSDLAVFSGGLLLDRVPGAEARVAALLDDVVAGILDAAGTPEEAGEAYPEAAEQVRARVRGCAWASIGDDDGACFTESPGALVRWAPISDQLKQFDVEIVENSVSFRWIEVRRDLRAALDARAVLDGAAPT